MTWLTGYSTATAGKPYAGTTLAEMRGYQQGLRALPGIRQAQRAQLARLGTYDRETGTWVKCEPGVGKGQTGEGL